MNYISRLIKIQFFPDYDIIMMIKENFKSNMRMSPMSSNPYSEKIFGR